MTEIGRERESRPTRSEARTWSGGVMSPRFIYTGGASDGQSLREDVASGSRVTRVTATVSGSFHRSMGAIQDAVYALTDLGVTVLSPSDPRVVDEFGDFLFVASDYTRALRLVESRHLAAIKASDFVWLVAPDGYIGQSAAMEIGYAVATNTPVYSLDVPTDLTLRQYVQVAARLQDAIQRTAANPPTAPPGSSSDLLLDPNGAVETAHADLEALRASLMHKPHDRDASPAVVDEIRERLRETLLK
jgi:hypothetical protein